MIVLDGQRIARFGSARIGNVTDYTDINSTGGLQLYGQARVERHLILDPKRFKLPGTDYPSESFTGLYYTLDFDAGAQDESAHCQEHIPFRWSTGTNYYFKFDWLYTGSQDNGTVVWGVEYKVIRGGDTVDGSGTTITQKSVGSHPTSKLVRTIASGQLPSVGLQEDDILALRVYRHSSDGVNDTLAVDAKLVNLHIHFVQDKLGKAL